MSDDAKFNLWTATLSLIAAALLFGCVSSTAGAADADLLPITVKTQRLQDVREGHVTLRWERREGVAGYEVLDQDGRMIYQGVASEAFLSGLPDGEHQFVVRGIDSEGRTIAQADAPIVVEVKHWPLAQALVLFVIGLVVVLSVMGVILRGMADRGFASPDNASTGQVSGDV